MQNIHRAVSDLNIISEDKIESYEYSLNPL